MSNIREELSEIMSHEGNQEREQENKDGKAQGGRPEITDAVKQAMQEAFERQETEKKEADYQKRLSKVEAQKQRETKALQEATTPVIKAIQEEIAKDKNFEQLIEDNQDFPESLIQYCAEIGEPEEAPGILRELASNDSYRKQLEKADTEIKKRRLISKIQRDIITGGSQGKVPEMLTSSIAQLNPNTAQNSETRDFRDIAIRHGLK